VDDCITGAAEDAAATAPEPGRDMVKGSWAAGKAGQQECEVGREGTRKEQGSATQTCERHVGQQRRHFPICPPTDLPTDCPSAQRLANNGRLKEKKLKTEKRSTVVASDSFGAPRPRDHRSST
jgi:hypothetical protein